MEMSVWCLQRKFEFIHELVLFMTVRAGRLEIIGTKFSCDYDGYILEGDLLRLNWIVLIYAVGAGVVSYVVLLRYLHYSRYLHSVNG